LVADVSGAFAQYGELGITKEEDQIRKYDIFNQNPAASDYQETAQTQRFTMSGGNPEFDQRLWEQHQRKQEVIRQTGVAYEQRLMEEATRREKWKAKGFHGFSDNDYRLLEKSQPIIDSHPADQKQTIMERLAAASVYSRNLNLPIDTTYKNLETIHKQWTEQQVFVKKSGMEAVVDSFGFSLALIVIAVLLIAGLGVKAVKKRRKTE
jgi:hypothetical protein